MSTAGLNSLRLSSVQFYSAGQRVSAAALVPPSVGRLTDSHVYVTSYSSGLVVPLVRVACCLMFGDLFDAALM